MDENLNNNEQNLNNDEQNLNNNEQNLNNNMQNNKKNNGSKIAIIVCIVIILLLSGILIGLVVSSSKNNTKQDNNKSEQNSSVGRVEDTAKNSIKIDDSKDWVYDADYNKGKEVKTVNNDEGMKSSDTLKYPYVNINSKYAEKVNSEIKANYENNYKHYGTSYPEKEISGSYFARIEYEYYVTDKILSLKINEWFGAVPGGMTPNYYIYNFNLETLEEASLEDVYKECGFKSFSELNDKINITISNEKAKENLLSDSEWYNNMFYMGKNSVFNIIVNGPVNIQNLEIKTNVTKIDNKTENKVENKTDNNVNKPNSEENKDSNNSSNSTEIVNDGYDNGQGQTIKSDFEFMADDGFKNVTYESAKVNNSYFYKIVFGEDGTPTISVEYISSNGNNMYGTYREFFNIRKDIGAGNVYVTFNYKAENQTSSYLSGTIHYNNEAGNNSISLKLDLPENNKEITLNKVK